MEKDVTERFIDAYLGRWLEGGPSLSSSSG